MNPTTQTTPDIDRAAALRALVAMTETLPAPESIRFAPDYPNQLHVRADSVTSLHAWATALNVNNWVSRGSRHGNTTQWCVYGNWNGYSLWVDHITIDATPACDCIGTGA